MAISNAVGSNVFDILLCLGLPWFLQTTIVDRSGPIQVYSAGKKPQWVIAAASFGPSFFQSLLSISSVVYSSVKFVHRDILCVKDLLDAFVLLNVIRKKNAAVSKVFNFDTFSDKGCFFSMFSLPVTSLGGNSPLAIISTHSRCALPSLNHSDSSYSVYLPQF